MKVAFIALMLLVAGCQSGPSTAPVQPTPNIEGTVQARVALTVGIPSPAAKPVTATATAISKPVADQPVAFTGKGTLKTTPFTLSGGNYTIEWKATDSPTGVGCAHGGAMRHADGSPGSENVGGSGPPKGETTTGTTQAYNVKAGIYYLDMISGCEWSVTIKPQ